MSDRERSTRISLTHTGTRAGTHVTANAALVHQLNHTATGAPSKMSRHTDVC